MFNPGTALAILQVGEALVTVVITDEEKFRAWLAQNTDAADTAQLQANDAVFAAAILEEQQKAAGG